MGCRTDYLAWTPSEDAELTMLLKAGRSKRQAARILGRPESSVHTRADVLQKKTTQRACMCCGKKFASEGPHNRLCTTCRNKSFSPYAY